MDPEIEQLKGEIRALVDVMTALNKTLGSVSNQFGKSVDGLVKETDKVVQSTKRQGQSIQDYVKQQEAATQATKAQTQATKAQTEAAVDNRTAQERAREAYRDNWKEVAKNTNYVALLARQQLDAFKASHTFTATLQNLNRDSLAYQKTLIVATNTLADLGGGFKGFLGSVANGKTSFDALSPIIDGIGKALSGIPFVGPALQAAAEGAKYLLNQLQQATETFQKFGAAGALTTEGMSGVQRQFLQSGMSLDGFRKAVTENAATLARFGGTAGRGAEAFSQIVGQILDSDVGDQLRRLGYSADAFGDATADYLQQQTRLGVAQTRTNAQLAQGAAAYAKELDTLAKATGMQREEIQKQQQAAMSESRFRAKLDELTAQGKHAEAKALLDFQSMVNKASPEMAQGLRDLATGNATTEAAQQVLRMGGQNILRDVEAGILGPVDAFKQMQTATQQVLPTMRGLAMAVGDETKAFTNYAQASDLANARIVDGQVILAEQNKQMTKGNDQLTDTTVSAQKSMEQMSRQLQGLAFKILPSFSSVIEKTTSVMRDALQKLGVTLPTAGAAGGGAAAGGGGGGAGGGGAGAGAAAGGGARGGGGVIGSVARFLGMGGGGGLSNVLDAEDIMKNMIVFGGGKTGTQAHFDQLNPDVKNAFLQMARDYSNFTGDKLQINSAFRSPEEQAAIDPGANPKAAPGMSLHNVGRALDIQSTQRAKLEELGLLSKYGFKTLPNDPPHIFMQTGGVATGPRSGYQAMLHGTEAVVPLPDGKTIPVEMPNLDRNMQEQVTMMGAQLVALEELVRYMRDNNAISSKLLQAARN